MSGGLKFPTHLCIRCGCLIYNPNSACRDCYSVDALLVKTWRASA